MTNEELYSIQKEHKREYVEAPKYEYEILMYRYHIEEKLYEKAMQGMALEVKEKMGEIHKDLNRKLKPFLRATNHYESYVEIAGYYAMQYGKSAKQELVQMLDRELGIVDNDDLHLNLCKHKRQMLYYFDLEKKEYGYIIRLENEK